MIGQWKSKGGTGSPLRTISLTPSSVPITEARGLRNLEDHPSATRHEQREVATTLDHIPEALLTIDKHDLASNISSAQPQWLLKLAPKVPLLSFPPPFVKPPSFGKVAGEKLEHCLAESGFGIVRVKPNRAAVACERFVEPSQFHQCDAAIRMCG